MSGSILFPRVTTPSLRCLRINAEVQRTLRTAEKGIEINSAHLRASALKIRALWAQIERSQCRVFEWLKFLNTNILNIVSVMG